MDDSRKHRFCVELSVLLIMNPAGHCAISKRHQFTGYRGFCSYIVAPVTHKHKETEVYAPPSTNDDGYRRYRQRCYFMENKEIYFDHVLRRVEITLPSPFRG